MPARRASFSLAVAFSAAAAGLLAAPLAAVAADPVPAASTAKIPGGEYTLDKSHASVVFRVDHLGFSRFTGRFTRFDAKLAFDPAQLRTARLEATIDPRSITSDNAPAGFLESLAGAQWLDAAKYPQITFRTTRVTLAAGKRMRVLGDFTLRGVTKPLLLDVVWNGGYAGHPMDPNARIGFSARGALKRSDYGIAFGIPAPGTNMGVGDTVEIAIEAEFTGPPLAGAAAAAPASGASR